MDKFASLDISSWFWLWSQYISLLADRQNLIRIWKNASRDLKYDLKNTRWLRGFGWFAGVIWLFGLITTVIYIGIAATYLTTNSACQPDGSFRIHPETYSMWSSSGFFQITLGGGHLTFAEAKVVDIVWDVIVGRGGQFLLAFISWRVFAKYLTICMEIQPVTYQLFRTIFLEEEASLPSTCRTIKSLLFQRRLRSKTAMAFMVVTMIFILAFPTLSSAMSGYDANVASYIPDRNHSFIPVEDFSRVLYVIHDGWRINQDGNYWIKEEEYYSSGYCAYYRDRNMNDTTECNLQNSVSAYVTAHGLLGTKNEPTRFDDWTTGNNITLKAPALNISAYIADDKTLGGQNSSVGLLNVSWVTANKTYDITYIEKNGSCQTMGDYKWGFSFLQLFVWIILLLIWTIGIYTMWLRTHFTMKLRKRHPDDISGEHRAVIELAVAMQQELDIQDIDSSMLREKQLKERVNEELKGGAISYAYPKSELQIYSIKKGLKTWFKREKWWFGAIFVTSILVCSTQTLSYPLSYPLRWFGRWCVGVWFGLFWAFCVATTNGSKALITLFWSVIFAIVIISLKAAY